MFETSTFTPLLSRMSDSNGWLKINSHLGHNLVQMLVFATLLAAGHGHTSSSVQEAEFWMEMQRCRWYKLIRHGDPEPAEPPFERVSVWPCQSF